MGFKVESGLNFDDLKFTNSFREEFDFSSKFNSISTPNVSYNQNIFADLFEPKNNAGFRFGTDFNFEGLKFNSVFTQEFDFRTNFEFISQPGLSDQQDIFTQSALNIYNLPANNISIHGSVGKLDDYTTLSQIKDNKKVLADQWKKFESKRFPSQDSLMIDASKLLLTYANVNFIEYGFEIERDRKGWRAGKLITGTKNSVMAGRSIEPWIGTRNLTTLHNHPRINSNYANFSANDFRGLLFTEPFKGKRIDYLLDTNTMRLYRIEVDAGVKPFGIFKFPKNAPNGSDLSLIHDTYIQFRDLRNERKVQVYEVANFNGSKKQNALPYFYINYYDKPVDVIDGLDFNVIPENLRRD